MWIIRFFMVFVGLALLYMVVTQQSVPMEFGSVNSRSYSLWEHPVGFMIVFIALCAFEWALIRVHAQMAKEEDPKTKRKRKRRKQKGKPQTDRRDLS